MKRNEIIEFALNSFQPLTEEEQKAMMMVILDCYLETEEKIEDEVKSKNKKPDVFRIERLKEYSSIYSFVLSFLTKNNIVDTRKFLLKKGFKLLQKQKEHEGDA